MRHRDAMLLGLTGAAAFVAATVLRPGPRPPAPPVLPRDAGTVHSTVASRVLGREMPIEVFVPPGGGPADGTSVLFLFHGRGGDASTWMSGATARGVGIGIDTNARRLIDAGAIERVAIVSATIDDSYGVNSEPIADGYDHGPYERYIVEELIPSVEARFGIGGSPGRRLIGGVSMGGFAALHAAFRHPELFAGVAGLSPATFVDTPADRAWILGGEPGAADPLELAAKADLGAVRVFLGVGRSDYGWIRDATGVLVERLRARGVEVTLVEIDGGHDTMTWRGLAEPMLLALVPARQRSAP